MSAESEGSETMTETAASKFGGSPVNEPRSYRKKPVVIEAIRYNGHNFSAISVWAGADIAEHFSGGLSILTREGEMRAEVGDWIIRGVAGEFYPCKPDIFDATYEFPVLRQQ